MGGGRKEASGKEALGGQPAESRAELVSNPDWLFPELRDRAHDSLCRVWFPHVDPQTESPSEARREGASGRNNRVQASLPFLLS